MHLIFQNIFGDLYCLSLRFANDLIALVLYSLIVTSSREPIANSQLNCVPLGLILDSFLNFLSLRALFNSVLCVLEHNTFNWAMVDLTELVRASCLMINHKTATQVILDLEHVACHRAALTSDDLFCEFCQLWFVFEVGCLNQVNSFFLRRLFPKRDRENVILHALEELGEPSHVHTNFIFKVICTVHAFENILRNVKCVAKLVFNRDSVPSYLFDV